MSSAQVIQIPHCDWSLFSDKYMSQSRGGWGEWNWKMELVPVCMVLNCTRSESLLHKVRASAAQGQSPCCTRSGPQLHKVRASAAQGQNLCCTRSEPQLHKVRTSAAQGQGLSCTRSGPQLHRVRASAVQGQGLSCTRSGPQLYKFRATALQGQDFNCTRSGSQLHKVRGSAADLWEMGSKTGRGIWPHWGDLCRSGLEGATSVKKLKT